MKVPVLVLALALEVLGVRWAVDGTPISAFLSLFPFLGIVHSAWSMEHGEALKQRIQHYKPWFLFDAVFTRGKWEGTGREMCAMVERSLRLEFLLVSLVRGLAN